MKKNNIDINNFINNVTYNCFASPVMPGGTLYPDIFNGNIGAIEQAYVTNNGQPKDFYIFNDNNNELSGAGVSNNPQEALLKACVEALERYSSTIISPEDIVISSGEALSNTMVMNNIPIFSENELIKSPDIISKYNASKPIRWTLGYSCNYKKQVYLPLVMTHFVQNRLDSEKFYLPISTGTAAHFNRDDAIQKAILEIIERDVISTIWLAKIPLPKLKLSSELNSEIIEIIETSNQTHRPITIFVHLGEFGIPTFYAIRRNPNNFQLGTVVGCSTNFNINEGILKAISEVFSVEIALEEIIKQKAIPKKAEDCIKIHDGALYTGQSIYNSAFDFLLQSPYEVTYSEILQDKKDFASAKELINHLIDKHLDIYLCDLTLDDIRDVGIHVIRAIIPELLPFSCIMKARYLGSKRLHSIVKSYYQENFHESDINSFPQPFA